MSYGAYWRPGDPPGQRQLASLFDSTPLRLESGAQLGRIHIAYEHWGRLAPDRSNAVLLLHGFTGDSHAAGPPGPGHPAEGWWDGLVGPGKALDTERYYVVCPNVLGGCQGSTGPASLAADGQAYGSRFPALTIRDLVAADLALAKHLRINRWRAVIGGSLGGMRALEWAISYPDAVESLVVLASTARCSPETIAFHTTQIQAISLDPPYLGGDYYLSPWGGPRAGLALARAIARLTYGCSLELNGRFVAHPHAPIKAEVVEHFLADEGEQLVRRFDPNSYITLTRAMNGHDVGRGRGGIPAALERITAAATVVSVSSDRLFPCSEQQQLAEAIPRGARFSSLESDLGHDGFLGEEQQLDRLLRQALA